MYAWEKLLFQLGLGLLVGWFLFHQGDGQPDLHHVLNLPFQKTFVGLDRAFNPSLIYFGVGTFVVWSTLFVAGLSNAANITDGMDRACGRHQRGDHGRALRADAGGGRSGDRAALSGAVHPGGR